MLLLRRSGEHAKRYSQAGSRGYRRSRQGDERRPIIRAEAHMLQGQTESRSRILHCPADLIAPAIAMMPVFHELSRAGGPSQQRRKTTAGSGLRTPGALLGGDEVAMAVFHELSRAEGPSQQSRKTTSHIAEPRTCRFAERHASLDYP